MMPMTTITNHCTNQHISLARLVALVGEVDLARLFCTEFVSSESPENYSLILAPSWLRCILDLRQLSLSLRIVVWIFYK